MDKKGTKRKWYLHKNSIEFKLKLSFLVIIIGLTALITISTITNFVAYNKQNAKIDNLILESEIPVLVDNVLNECNDMLINGNHKSGFEKHAYYTIKNQTHDTFRVLDVTIKSKVTKMAYERLRDSVKYIFTGIDEIIVLNGNLNKSEADARYIELLSKKDEIDTLSNNLLWEQTKEIKYARTQFIRSMIGTFAITLACIAIAVFASIKYAGVVSQRITHPVMQLSDTAQKISNGNLKKGVSKDVLQRNDEIGDLGHCFNKMVSNLQSKIVELEKSNEAIKKAEKRILKKNEELEKFNSIIIGRELKMIELKEILAQSRQKLLKYKHGNKGK